jgi:hypothetical protein
MNLINLSHMVFSHGKNFKFENSFCLVWRQIDMSPPAASPAASFEERTRELQRRIRAGIDMYTRTLDKVCATDVNNRRQEPVPPSVTWCVCTK